MYTRDINIKIKRALELGKIAIIYGPRQIGKTTLAKQVAEQISSSAKYLYLNADESSIDNLLTNISSTEIKSFIGDYKLLVIDEAQKVTNIGITLKLIHDTFPEIKIIATGSSSFDLANKILEPLTGRSFEYILYPFSLNEIRQKFSEFEINRLIGQLLVYGSYPEVFISAKADAEELLQNIIKNYLYKDILEYEGIKDSDLVNNLLTLLAFQLGNEVSYRELASKLGVNYKTVNKYIKILEKAYVIYRLKPLMRNKRKEVTSFKKVYFHDLGVRNALIGNFSPIDFRDDKGALWENFCINERMKFYQAGSKHPNTYFWRNYYGAEVDFIEEESGELRGFEFKWKKDKFTKPKAFMENYERANVKLINQDKIFDLWKDYKKI